MNNQPRRKGFSFLSFFLGFLIGIIFLVGAVAGVVYFALSAKLDDVFNMVGVDNSKDENGNNKVINTDPENGGVETLLQLVSKVAEIAGDTSNLSVGEVENLIPAIGGMVDSLHETLNGYIQIDRAELVSVKFSEFGEYVSNKILDIQPAALMDSFGMGGLLENKIMSLLLEGVEAQYVVIDEVKYPVYYDIYTLEDGNYKRGDGKVLPSELQENLFDYKVGETDAKRINYYVVGETAYVTDKDCTYSAPVARATPGSVYSPYTPDYATLSGNYYKNGEEKVIVDPVTLGTLSNGGLSSLDNVYITEFIEGDDQLAETILGDVTVGDILNGTIDFDGMLNSMALSDIMKTKVDDNSIMLNLIWKIKDAEAVEVAGADYTHTGKYTVGEGEQAKEYVCYITTEEGEDGVRNISGAYYFDDKGEKKEITSITVGDLMDGFDLNGIIEDITISEFVYIKASDAIMSYIGYGLYEIKNDNGIYTGKVDIDGVPTECNIFVDADGKITKVETKDGVTVKSVGLNDVSANIGGITEKLTIGDLVGETSDPIIKELAPYHINNVKDGIDNLKLSTVMTIDDSNKVLSLIADATIKELPERINSLTINEMFASDIYSVKDSDGNIITEAERKRATEYHKEYLYYTKDGDKFTLVKKSGELGKLTQAEFNDGTDYYTYGEAKGEWKILLNAKDGEKSTEKAYTLNNLSQMISNVSFNMQRAPLQELSDSKILIFPEGSLKKTINGRELGTFTILEVISYVVSLPST